MVLRKHLKARKRSLPKHRKEGSDMKRYCEVCRRKGFGLTTLDSKGYCCTCQSVNMVVDHADVVDELRAKIQELEEEVAELAEENGRLIDEIRVQGERDE